ncbi:hypothetical protein AX15_004644 [Amanita polypyramis BW_CC]|nr:hypothetical protein AX15_004644 [Amanita polypyramis BW_CC]
MGSTEPEIIPPSQRDSAIYVPPQLLDSAEDRRARHSSHGLGRMSTASIRSPFFLITLFLAISSWIFGFISQAIVTAQVNNGPIGTLWLAFVLQTILVFWVISQTFTSPSQTLQPPYNTFAHLASMTVVLAAIGVDKNIYSNLPAQKATAAGWLVTAVVDIFWIIYFSSEEHSAVRTVLDQSWSSSVGEGDGTGVMANGQQIGERRAIGVLSGKLPPLTSPSFRLKPTRLRKAKRESTGSQPPDIKIVEEGSVKDSIAPRTEPAAGGDNRLSVAHRSLSVNPGASSVGGDVSTDSRRVSTAPSGSASAKGSAGGGFKAEALFNYKGSDTDPHELTFVKGDIFEIIDQSGKWWEAVNKEGRVGIVPSNYVQLVEG